MGEERFSELVKEWDKKIGENRRISSDLTAVSSEPYRGLVEFGPSSFGLIFGLYEDSNELSSRLENLDVIRGCSVPNLLSKISYGAYAVPGELEGSYDKITVFTRDWLEDYLTDSII